MEREKTGEFAEVGFLPRKIEQDLRGRGKWMRRRIADHAQREQRQSVLGAGSRDKLCFHIDGDGASFAGNVMSIFRGADQV